MFLRPVFQEYFNGEDNSTKALLQVRYPYQKPLENGHASCIKAMLQAGCLLRTSSQGNSRFPAPCTHLAVSRHPAMKQRGTKSRERRMQSKFPPFNPQPAPNALRLRRRPRGLYSIGSVSFNFVGGDPSKGGKTGKQKTTNLL